MIIYSEEIGSIGSRKKRIRFARHVDYNYQDACISSDFERKSKYELALDYFKKSSWNGRYGR